MGRYAEPSAAEVTNELSGWAVGGGIITMALFPLALPFLALTAVAVIPLVLPVVVVGIVAWLVALPVLLARRLMRRRSRESPARLREGSGVPTAP